jgi:hypothetical protein
MIRYVKEHLSIAERANGDGKWVDHIPAVLAAYNGAKIRGTNLTRSSINQHNYLKFLGQLRKSTEPSMLFNMAETFRYPTALAKYLWRYRPGQKVLLARRVDYAIRDKNYFEKASVKGPYGPKVFTVTECLTKLNSDFFLTPVYRLDSGMTGLYYESELSPALFAEPKKTTPQPPAGTATGRRQRRSGKR